MDRIVTLTVNPSVDLSASVESVVPLHKLRCTDVARDPGGGGINVARVVARLGGNVEAVYTQGGAIGRMLESLLAREKLASHAIVIAGETREDFTVQDSRSGDQYRFVLPGPQLEEGEWRSCLEALAALSPPPAFLVASGSLPPGVPEDFYARVARIANAAGSRFVLDSSGSALAAALAEPIHLIKPNLREMTGLIGRPLASREERVAAARELVATRRVEAVALTLGAEGGLLVTRDEVLYASAPPVQPVSAVGAGDSFLGGLVHALSKGGDNAQALRCAIAAGTAALLTPGTELCRAADVERLRPRVELRRLDLPA